MNFKSVETFILLFFSVCRLSFSQCPPAAVTCDQTDPGTSISTNFAGEVICVTTDPGSNINLTLSHDDVILYVCDNGTVFNTITPRSGFEFHASNSFGTVRISSINANNPNSHFYSDGGGRLRIVGGNLNTGPVNFYSQNGSDLLIDFPINTANEINVDIDTNSTGEVDGDVTMSNGNFNVRQGATFVVNGNFHGNGTNVRVINYDSMYVDGEFYVQGTNAFQNACGESTLDVTGDFRLNSSSSLINEGTIRASTTRINSSSGPISMGEASNFLITNSIDAQNTEDVFEYTGSGGGCALVQFGTIGNWNFDLTADPEIHYCGPSASSKPGDATISCVCNATPVYCDKTLPVEFIYIKALSSFEDTKILWATAEEINNSHFVIQRSYNGINFENIGVVEGSGNSSSVITYEFIDYSAEDAPFVYYRIQQIDFDGAYEFSKIVAVSNTTNDLVKLVNNPVQAGDGIQLVFFESGEYNITLIDVLGKTFFTIDESVSGNQMVTFRTDSDLYSGVFNLLISNGEKSEVIKILVNN